MQCDETISHMVTAGLSYFRTLRNACVTAGKTYYDCFEMLSLSHRTSANSINTCFWLLETCTKCSYFIEENIRPGAQRLATEVKYEYIVRRPRIYRVPAFCGWASFQTTGVRCVRLDDFFDAQTVLHKAGKILRWWYLSIIVGVHLLFNAGNFVQSWTAAVSEIPQKYNPNAFFL